MMRTGFSINKLANELVGLAEPEKKGIARGRGQDLLAAARRMDDAPHTHNGNISLANF